MKVSREFLPKKTICGMVITLGFLRIYLINAAMQVTGQWKGASAGGCANNRETWPHNPRFKLVIDSLSTLQVH